MKCQRCPKPVTYHITEVISESHVEDLHFCVECFKKYLFSTPLPGTETDAEKAPGGEFSKVVNSLGEKSCPECSMKFVEFRNCGRLGCPHDYDVFSEDLIPLIEGVHGNVRHVGKTPRNRPKTKSDHSELSTLRKKLQKAVDGERYEEAASIRDKIKQLESS
jgi:protein arginine kinase activator